MPRHVPLGAEQAVIERFFCFTEQNNKVLFCLFDALHNINPLIFMFQNLEIFSPSLCIGQKSPFCSLKK